MTALTLFFDTISNTDLSKVGGKGANLGELTRAGFNVPSGFCVTTSAFSRFLAAANEDIYLRLANVPGDDLKKLRHVGGAVRAHLESVALPAEVEDAVVSAWSELGKDHAYAVRSSATAEDLPYASFAGQQDSYLNVRGKEALLANVKACFISLFTDRAILYRVQNGFDHRQVALAVVVQRMVQPDVAGILFTADPISGRRDIASINASFGLGEALVSGLVSADLYQVNKQTKQIVKKQIVTKQIAIRSLAEGGTGAVELPKEEREQPALNDEQVLALAKLGSQIEAHYRKPQDIEWALLDDALYVTQSRPITSLYPLPRPGPEDDALHVYFSMSHFQVMTDAMPPLTLSVLRTILPLGHADGQLESKRIQSAGGRLYADLAPLLRHPLGRRMLLRGMSNADQLAANALAEFVKRPEFGSAGEYFNPLSLLPAARPYIFKMLHMLFWGQPEGVAKKSTKLIDDHIATVKTKLETANDIQEKLNLTLLEMQNAFKPILNWAPYLVSGGVATVLLKTLLGKKGDANDLVALGRGLKGNVATEMNLAVGDLADAARTSEVLMAHLNQTDIDAKTKLAEAAVLPGGKSFLQAWHNFISTYGARAPSEIDLSRPRWSEDPSSLLQMIVNATGQSRTGAHRTRYQQLITEGEEAAHNLIEAAYKGWWGWLRGPLINRFIRVSRNLTPLREHHKFLVIRFLALVKTVLLEAGKKLQAEGRLKSYEDIWFLTLPEVLEAFDKPEKKLKALITERQSAFKHYQNLTPPRLITNKGEIPALRLQTNAPKGALVGSPVSAGVVEGIAKVVLEPGAAVLKPGEILVAPFTDPGWTPLFVNAAGLITEVGGLMTHGSVVAREYGIPAVVGVLDATKQIKTGQRVRVHGDAGYIELLTSKDKEMELTSR